MAAISEPEIQPLDAACVTSGCPDAPDHEFASDDLETNDPTTRGLANNDAKIDDPVVARLELLWNQRQLLLRFALWGLIAFTTIAFVIPRRYRSTTLLMPPDDQSNSGMAVAAALAGKMDGAIGGLAGGLLGLKSSGDLFIGILGSRTVEDDLISKYDLRKVYGESLWQDARRRLSENTEISQDHKSGIIAITVTDRNPQRAEALTQEYVAELNTVVGQMTTSSAHRERVFLENRLGQVERDLRAAEKDFSEFASRNATLDIKEQGRAEVEAAATLQGQLIAAQSELQGLKQIYSDQNVRVRSVRARAAELQNSLEQLGGKPESGTASGGQDEGAVYPSLRKLPLLGVTYADLYRQAKIQEAVFSTLTQQLELAKVAEAKQIPTVKVLDPPSLPERRSFPPRLLIITSGTFFSLLVSIVWVLGRARWGEIDNQAPRKILTEKIMRGMYSRMPWNPHNRSRLMRMTYRVWRGLKLRNRFEAESR